MTVTTKGLGIVGDMEFDLHHDVDTDKLIASIRKNRKNIKQIGLTRGGKLFIKADLGKLRGNHRSALLELHDSLKQQIDHVNDKAKSPSGVVSA